GPAVFDESEWQTMFSQRFCVVSDNVLSFLLDTATEITARIKLRDDGLKTVQKGGLWYEEALPTETILYGFVLATPTAHHKKQNVDESEIFRVIEDSIQPMVQLGGKATVGRGLCRLQLEGAA
ncbi:MAG TPA: type III-B CRISPR module RAMP protein Cmr4, partial [Pyrinomonadaceae bacterium]|nr:type III-B CRISPR module RAMP protein Cmr4 [Pyrinomonadaceae bacterium]